jgi:hypothetical protein
VLGALRPAGRIADGAAEIAGIRDFDEGEAGMLFVVGAKAAIVGTAPLHGGVVNHRHFGALDENFAAAAIVIDVIGDKDSLATMLGTVFQKENLVVLEDDFAFQFVVANGADGQSNVVKHVGADTFGHSSNLYFKVSQITR